MKLGIILVFLCCWLNPLFCAVDVYVFNVGQGNFIWVSMDMGDPNGPKKVLIVDCGYGGGKKWISEKTFEDKLDQMGLLNGAHSYALWLTHLHRDHFNLLFYENLLGRPGTILQNMEYVFAGVGGSVRGRDRSFNYWPISELPPNAKKIRTGKMERFDQGGFYDEKRKKSKTSLGQICTHLQENVPGRCFPIKIWDYDPGEIGQLQWDLSAFTDGTGCQLRPLLPAREKNYNEGKEPTNPNGQSLVLALDYGGRRVIFPGDAPGDLFLALSEDGQMRVVWADVFIAPHHGSISNKENLWETYNEKSAIRPRYCTIVSSIPVPGDNIPNKEFMNKRPSHPAFVATAHPILVYDPVESRNRIWMTRQTKFSMDENICYYHYRIENGGAQSLHFITKSDPSEQPIGIIPLRNMADLEGWESDWGADE